jgi:hypothetical protein
MDPGEIEENKNIFSLNRQDIGIRGEPTARREVTGKDKKRPKPVNIDSFDTPMKPFGKSRTGGNTRKAPELILDNNMENSDWVKKFSLDIPGISTIKDIEQLFNIPEDGKERIETLKNISKNYQWLDAYNPILKPIIDKEIAEYDGKNNETN